jgi:hypothetical protein
MHIRVSIIVPTSARGSSDNQWPDADHETKKQYFNMASGDGRPWLFVQYEYVRKR